MEIKNFRKKFSRNSGKNFKNSKKILHHEKNSLFRVNQQADSKMQSLSLMTPAHFSRHPLYILSSSPRSVIGVGITRESFSIIARARSLKIPASFEFGECSTTAPPSSSQAWMTELRGTNRTKPVPRRFANSGMTACSKASSPLLLQMMPARPVSPRPQHCVQEVSSSKNF